MHITFVNYQQIFNTKQKIIVNLKRIFLLTKMGIKSKLICFLILILSKNLMNFFLITNFNQNNLFVFKKQKLIDKMFYLQKIQYKISKLKHKSRQLSFKLYNWFQSYYFCFQ
ncbi:hypothetical protein pb186bvf_004327 [Paramecium bursaria]